MDIFVFTVLMIVLILFILVALIIIMEISCNASRIKAKAEKIYPNCYRNGIFEIRNRPAMSYAFIAMFPFLLALGITILLAGWLSDLGKTLYAPLIIVMAIVCLFIGFFIKRETKLTITSDGIRYSRGSKLKFSAKWDDIKLICVFPPTWFGRRFFWLGSISNIRRYTVYAIHIYSYHSKLSLWPNIDLDPVYIFVTLKKLIEESIIHKIELIDRIGVLPYDLF